MLKFRQLFLFAIVAIVAVSGFAGCADPKKKSKVQVSKGKPGIAKPVQPQEAKALPVSENPVELGKIAWGRNFEKAQKQSDKTGKPIYLMLDEVPGCMGCKDFGTKVLSHPMVVAAINENFIPVFINNRPDKYATEYDKQMVKFFKESYWSYPVVRYMDKEGKDIIPRKQTLKLRENINRIMSVLKKRKVKLPVYLEIAEIENADRKHEVAFFNMGCFWSGERKLGKINGVVYQSFGFVKGSGGADEVVKVTYDPSIITLEKLLKIAKKNMCATRFIARDEDQLKIARKIWGKNAMLNKNPMREEEPQYSLKMGLPAIYYVPLTPLQAVKVNSYYNDPKIWKSILTPGQLVLAKRIDKFTSGKKTKQIHKMFKSINPDKYRRLKSETITAYTKKLEKLLDEMDAKEKGAEKAKPAKVKKTDAVKSETIKCPSATCPKK